MSTLHPTVEANQMIKTAVLFLDQTWGRELVPALSLDLSLSHIPLSASPRQSPFVSLHLNTVIFPVSPPSCLSLSLARSFTSTVLIVRIEIRLIMCRRVDSPGLIAPLLFHVKESERFDEENKKRTEYKQSRKGMACEIGLVGVQQHLFGLSSSRPWSIFIAKWKVISSIMMPHTQSYSGNAPSFFLVYADEIEQSQQTCQQDDVLYVYEKEKDK